MDHSQIRNQICLIQSAVADFGSALSAMDRGYDAAAERLEAEGHEHILSAFRNAPELQGLLPNLWAHVEAGANLADQGFEITREVNAALRRLPKTPDQS